MSQYHVVQFKGITYKEAVARKLSNREEQRKEYGEKDGAFI